MDDRYIFIDVETTGLSPFQRGHRIIELCCIEYIGKIKTGKIFHHLLNPEGKKSTTKAFKVHQISDEQLEDKPTFSNISNTFVDFIKGAHVVTYNTDFDITFINAELNRAKYQSTIADIASHISCAMKLAANKFGLSRISLDSACRRYNIDLSRRIVHGALIDAELAAELYFNLIDKAVKPLRTTPQISSQKVAKAIPIPRAYKHPETGNYVQLNFCKNPQCKNFGVPAKNPKKLPDGKPKRGLGNDYRLGHIKDKKEYVLICKLCGQSTQLVSNRAYANEQVRLSKIGILKEPACPNTGNSKEAYGVRYEKVTVLDDSGNKTVKKIKKPPCKNSKKGLFTNPEFYKLDGKTRKLTTWVYVDKVRGRKGMPSKQTRFVEMTPSQRVRCKTCNTRFSIKMDPQQRHYLREKNEAIFLSLVNKGIINRVIEQFELSPKTVYDKINFFYEQCIQFEKYQHYFLAEKLRNKNLSLSIDRQHYLSNWGDNNMPMPTRIVNTSTADNVSGYVFSSTVNFDFTTDYELIKREHREKKEFKKANCYRRFAQYILDNEELQDNVENNEELIPLQTPAKGLLVHQTYSILAHLAQLKSLLEPCKHIELFADNDAGFKLGISAIFQDWISSNKLSAFQVMTERNGGNRLLDNQNNVLLQKRYKELKEKQPDATRIEIMRQLWHENISTRITLPGTRSEWILHPNSRSRFDAILPLTPVNDEVLEQLINSLQSASLNAVDNWFQILRRHINMLERPVTSGTNSKRWNAYAGYNPEWMSKLLEIKRIYFNFCMMKKKSSIDTPFPFTTPSMRLGISDECHTIDDILNFNIINKIIK